MIRKAAKDDLEQVHKLLEELENHPFEFENFKSVYLANIQDDKFHYFVAESEEKVVGFMGVFIYEALHNCHKVAEIQELIVENNHRSKQIGKGFLQKLETLATENNWRLIELTSNNRRTHAHAFYIRNGYKRGHFRFKKEINL